MPAYGDEGLDLKVVFVMLATRMTGGHRTVFEFCNGLAQRGNDVSIVSLGFRGDHRWFDLRVPVKYSRLGGLANLLDFAAGRVGMIGIDVITMLSRLIPQCDVAVATYFLTALATWQSPNCKHRAYFVQHFEPLTFSSPFVSRQALETYFLPIARATNSSWTRRQLLELTGGDCPVIHPGIDVSVFHPWQEPAEESRFRIVAYASPKDWKGFQDLVQAIKLLGGERKNIELVTFGTWRPTLRFQNVSFRHITSPTDQELARTYSGANAVICASWFESFPLPPLEAMACGAPVVTTPNGTEDYAVDSENCLIVPPKNPPALHRALTMLMDDRSLGDRIAKQGLITAKRFTWSEAVNRMSSFLESVASS